MSKKRKCNPQKVEIYSNAIAPYLEIWCGDCQEILGDSDHQGSAPAGTWELMDWLLIKEIVKKHLKKKRKHKSLEG